MPSKLKQPGQRDGFWFQLKTILWMCVLLILNVALVASLFRTVADDGPEWLRYAKVEQIVLLLGPLVLLVIEWWLLDVLRNQLRAAGRGGRRGPS